MDDYMKRQGLGPFKKRTRQPDFGMRVKHGYISLALDHFKDAFFDKFGLVEKGRQTNAMVMFGLYNFMDWAMLREHRYPVIMVWCGSESKHLTPMKIRMLLTINHVKHIATSRVISADLTRVGVAHELVPVSPAKMDIDPRPRGDKIYFYYGKPHARRFYGEPLAREVEKRTGLEVVYAAYNTYNREQLMDVYGDCFIGLRLTPRDGVSVTAVELGMMGRRVIFNGDTPSAIPWKGVDDICENVIKEYNNRHTDDTAQVSKQVKDYLDIGEKWLTWY